jgi:hypothetical protein
MRLRVALLAGFLLLPSSAMGQRGADSAAVHAAVADYLAWFYEGDTTRFVRSVRPEIYKYGYDRDQATGRYSGRPWRWPAGVTPASTGSARRQPRANAQREIVVLDVLDQIAVAKLVASWGVDYLMLAKYDGKWMINQALYQSHPPANP